MYLQHFNFTHLPFTITPDPGVLYYSHPHSEALKVLQYGLQREGGFLLLTGEVGTGKTTLTRLILQSLEQNGEVKQRVAYLLNPKLSEIELLYNIAEELGLELDTSLQVRELIAAINEALLVAHSVGQNVIVVIEEAQNLSPELLEMLRLLTNLETDTKKLLTILLVGQPELLDLINSQQLRQLKQRIIARYHLQPLSRSEVWRYLDYRLQLAKGNGNQLSSFARWAIYRYSQGIPRLINLLADNALLNAYRANRQQVKRSDIKHAVNMLGLKPQTNRLSRLLSLILIVVLVASVAWLWPKFNATDFIQQSKLALTPKATYQTEPTINSIDRPKAIQAGVEATTDAVANRQVLVNDALSTTTAAKTPLQQLLMLWGVATQLGDSWSQYCDTVPDGLYCYEQRQASVADIAKINIPLLVTLIDDKGSPSIAIVRQLSDQQIVLQVDQQQQTMPIAQFQNQWLQDIKLVRPEIPGFNGKLRLNGRNRELLNWVQLRLQERGILQETMITGGIYNQLLVDAIKQFQRRQGLSVDGVLGINTLLQLLPESERLNQLRLR